MQVDIPYHQYYTNHRSPKAKPSRLATYAFAVLLALIVLVLSSIRSRAADAFIVTIHIGDYSTTIATQKETVAEALEQAGIHVDTQDLVEPGLSTPLDDGFSINVYRARPIMVVDGDRSITVTTALRSSHLVAKAAGLNVFPEDRFGKELVQNFVQEGFIGEKITITRAKKVIVSVDGNQLLLRTHVTSIGDFFDEKGIALEGEDYASLPGDTSIKDGMKVSVVRVGHEVVAEEKRILFPTRVIKNYDLPYGEEEIEEAGSPGQILFTYNVTRHNGREVSRKLLSETVVRQPIERVVVKGMKIIPNYDSNAEIIQALRQCETGGNYTTNTGNGYYGAYQFLISTWDRVAPKVGRPDLVGVRPDRAAPADQDYMVIENARLSSGGFATQHPGCYHKLSLPKHPF